MTPGRQVPLAGSTETLPLLTASAQTISPRIGLVGRLVSISFCTERHARRNTTFGFHEKAYGQPQCGLWYESVYGRFGLSSTGALAYTSP